MEKILFLDFDGVITTYRSKYNIDIDKVDYINKIIDATSAKIVVTSSWKHGYQNVESFKEFLRQCNSIYISELLRFNDIYISFVDSIIDITETCNHYRGNEIKKYIEDNDITQYCILDDDSDMLDEQLFNFVQTDYVYGISEREVELCIDVLNGNKIIKPTRLNEVLTTMWRNKCSGQKNKIDTLLINYNITLNENRRND